MEPAGNAAGTVATPCGILPVMGLGFGLLLAYFLLYDEEDDSENAETEDEILDVITIEMYLGFKFGLRYYGMEIPSEGGEDAVPCSSSDSGEEKEVPEIHACQSGRDADKVTDSWDKAACYGGYLSVFVEVLLAFLYFFLI